MKRFITITALLVGGAVLVGSCPEVRKSLVSWGQAIEQNVSGKQTVERKIADLRQQVKQLDRKFPSLIDNLAELDTQIQDLQDEITTTTTARNSLQESLLAFAKAVKAHPDGEFAFASTTYSQNEADQKLKRDYSLFQTYEDAIASQKNLLSAKQKLRNAVDHRLKSLSARKRQYTAQLDRLEAEYTLVQSRTTNSVVKLDDSEDDNIEQAMKQIDRDVRVMKNRLHILNSLAEQNPEPQATTTEPRLDPDVVLNAVGGNAAPNNAPVQTVNQD